VNWTLMVERLRETNGLRWTQTWWWRDRSMAYRPAAVLLGPEPYLERWPHVYRGNFFSRANFPYVPNIKM